MISLAECAPCKAMRLQAEAEEEFRQRFGVVNAAPPALQGWRPWRPNLGQAVQAVSPAEPLAQRTYLEDVGERLLWFSVGGVFGFPLGMLSNVAFKSLRRRRNEAAVFAAITSGVGLMAALMPIKSPIMTSIARIAGVLTGSAVADVALPAKPVPPLPSLPV